MYIDCAEHIETLLDKLNGDFHRQRQGSVDEKLFNVISGFEAWNPRFEQCPLARSAQVIAIKMRSVDDSRCLFRPVRYLWAAIRVRATTAHVSLQHR